jgi:hypothetical protein
MHIAGRFGMEHELDYSAAVPEIDEDQPAMIASTVNPAGHAR